MRFNRSLGVLLLLLLASALALGAISPLVAEGAAKPPAHSHQSETGNPTALDLDGRPHDPFTVREKDVVVLIFVGVDCPISNRYAPEVRRICEEFKSRAVSFWLVQPDPDVSAKAMRRHLKEFNYPCDALRDPRHVLVRKAKATRVPECAVFDVGGELVYHGRINNRYADYGRARPQATEHDLRDAIAAVLAGRKPVRASVPAVGCHIPDLP